jgi:CitMHS family citrate-Mg2+:H+ or citrate-Ca2+:H+ symporter
MTDAGLLDPVVNGVLRAVGTNPVRIVVGSALLAATVHLEGLGSTSAFWPALCRWPPV